MDVRHWAALASLNITAMGSKAFAKQATDASTALTALVLQLST
jgi:hypothetical protein